MRRSIADDERAGAVEPYLDAGLYDWEHRRRRTDVAFYRRLADECGGPILDLGCGTGRLAVPLARDGHRVVGVDMSATMLARAAARLRRAGPPVAARCLVVRGDLRAWPVRGRFALAVAAFHTVQHFMDDDELLSLLRRVRRALVPGGWFAFDVFSPESRWLARPAHRRFDRTVFHHPVTGQRLAYTFSHRLDVARRALHMRFRYQPLTASGAPVGRERMVRLCHRQLPPEDVGRLLRRAGLRVVGRWAGFEEEPLSASASFESEQHIYLTTPTARIHKR